jgi:hypothetical protein
MFNEPCILLLHCIFDENEKEGDKAEKRSKGRVKE